MSEELAATHHDDQSHYEISLTAGQAFVAFVLLLLSLAASFAFGLMIGKGQADERLVVRKEPSVITEGNLVPAKKSDRGKIVELGVADDDFVAPTDRPAETTDSAAAAAQPVADPAAQQPAIIEETTPLTVTETVAEKPAEKPIEKPAEKPVERAAAPKVPHYAQLLSTSEKKTAEALAVKLINSGFETAYVQPGANEKGPIYRVRVRFPSEAEARAAEAKLREFSKEVWITAK
jgi:hypothetical protein